MFLLSVIYFSPGIKFCIVQRCISSILKAGGYPYKTIDKRVKNVCNECALE